MISCNILSRKEPIFRLSSLLRRKRLEEFEHYSLAAPRHRRLIPAAAWGPKGKKALVVRFATAAIGPGRQAGTRFGSVAIAAGPQVQLPSR